MIVFFDGACGLCDRAVRWLWDRTDVTVRFAPLQGETAKKYVPEKFRTPPLSTLVVWEDGRVLVESEGLAAIAYQMPGFLGRLARALTLPFARPLLNVGYRFVAHNRHRWFGSTCELVPDPKRLLP
jgi:predicted DCC family thiol-disulfide oxidoreductase YuxK